jgi:DNA-binding NarL/FixJ family response regulator
MGRKPLEHLATHAGISAGAGTRTAGGARPAGTVTVALVDDHPVVVDGVASWLRDDPARRVELIAYGDSLDAVLAASGARADVLLLDLNLHGQSVLHRVQELAAAGRRVVVFSQQTDTETVLTALDLGACAYLAKHEAREHCLAVLIAVAQDRPYVTPAMAGALIADGRPDRPGLSGQERNALLLWFQSMSMGSVARRMGISEHTARQYVKRARAKYAHAGRPAPTKTDLLARAIEDGLIRAEDVHG